MRLGSSLRACTGSRARTHAARAAMAVLAGVTLFGGASCRSAGAGPIYMALDGQGNRRRTVFFTDTDSIYCVAQVASGRADVTVTATITAESLWSDALQALVPVSQVFAEGETAPGVTSLAPQSFKLTQEPAPGQTGDVPFPVGTFTCHIAVDGEEEGTAPFSIVFPECPIPLVVDGVACRDWVRTGSMCPGGFGVTCTCLPSGVWSC